MKLIFIPLAILFLFYLSFDLFKENKEQTKIKKEVVKNNTFNNTNEVNNTHIEDNVKVSSITPKEVIQKTSGGTSYKDIFKEPAKDRLGEFQDQQHLEKLEDETNELISQAEALIKKHNLTLPKEELSKEELEKIKQYEQQIRDLKSQLGEKNDQ